jgi:diacylglycerol kinase (ATP)
VAVEAMNIPFVGPNIPLAVDAEMDDGELDLVLLRDEDRERLLQYVVGRVESASGVMPSLDVRRGRRIRMVPPAGWQLRIDDELVELDAEADARAVDILLRPGVVQVVGGRPNGDRA